MLRPAAAVLSPERNPRSAVLVALFELNVRAAQIKLENRTFQIELVATTAGLARRQTDTVLRTLAGEGLVHEIQGRCSLSRAGHLAVAEIVDVDQAIAAARAERA